MKLSVRVIFAVALLAGCSSAPVPLDEPLVVAFDWRPAGTDVALDPTTQQLLAHRGEALRVFFEHQFDARVGDVTFVAPADASSHPDRVELTISEFARQRFDQREGLYRNDSPDPNASAQRCGTVEYAVFLANRERRRDTFPLNCTNRPDELPIRSDPDRFHQRGFGDYEEAAARASREIAVAVKSVRSRRDSSPGTTPPGTTLAATR